MNRPPTLGEACRLWLRIGCVSFGGPVAQIDLLHRETVERRAWIDEREFLHALRLCTALPGPEAQQLACHLGHRLHGVRGALAAGGLFILPGLIVIVALAWLYLAIGDAAWLQGAVRTLAGAVVALVVAAGLRLGQRVVRTRWVLAIGVLAGAAMLLGLPYPAIVLVGAIAGVGLGRLRPTALVPLEDQLDPGVGTAPPPRPIARRAAVGLALWLGPVAALLLVGGVVAELTGLFTVAALVTFGGAYAVLPFVAAAAVDRFGWLTPEQMATGLALGETTPGPLILVNAFVGFLAGWGALGGAAGGIAGAAVAAFATFAPSFLLIVVGAPLVPRVPSRGPIADGLAALQGVVAGAVVVLALLLADAAFLRAGGVDALALGVAVAVLLLQRRGAPVPLLILGAGAIGVAASLLGVDLGVVG